ncbi:type VI secretion system-associated protein TagF [Achromobacter sp. NFACC18-2]|uniref:type VI secretion system-associated protein TagF n=1 Tax=Achromobacter sp. NFACC18-2 TaxID=1564112 RepID=UPI0008BA465E|nr:type VI secretion system-associated protein TagF [Achromobacter sp. NFACC18-2]SEJ77204.1 type VI secretion system protein ImpM [Achromobacter sp. NFACC18-2]
MNLPRPAYWGKLPAYGDFLRQGAPLDVQQAWRQWLEGPLREAWLASGLAQAHALPWSFVLRPGCLRFSGDRYVAGVYARSQDKFGREHPFLMWFLLAPASVSSLLSTHDNPLFCLARLLHGHLAAPGVAASGVAASGVAASGVAASGVTTPRRPALVDQINRLWRPGRAGVLGALRRRKDAPDFAAARGWADGWPSDTREDGLAGVPHAPWRNWPATVFEDLSQAWYWQQDVQAGYVSFLSVTAAEPADLA